MNRRHDTGRDWIGSIATLAAQAPDLYKIAHAVGQLRRRRRAERIAHRAGWLGAGALVGAGVVALMTPKTGPEIRRRISDQAGRVRNYIMRPISAGDGESGDSDDVRGPG